MLDPCQSCQLIVQIHTFLIPHLKLSPRSFLFHLHFYLLLSTITAKLNLVTIRINLECYDSVWLISTADSLDIISKRINRVRLVLNHHHMKQLWDYHLSSPSYYLSLIHRTHSFLLHFDLRLEDLLCHQFFTCLLNQTFFTFARNSTKFWVWGEHEDKNSKEK